MTVLTISGHRINAFFPVEEKASTTQYLERWRVGDKEVCLQRRDNKLYYEVIDTLTHRSTEGPINFGERGIEEAIQYLLYCQPEISQNGEVKFIPRHPLPYIKRWIVDDYEICLFLKVDQLSYLLLNNVKKEFTIGPVDSNGHPVRRVISYLIRCQPKVENGSVRFFPQPRVRYSWSFRNKEIKLLQNDNKLIWELFDKCTQTSSQAPFQAGFSLQKKLHTRKSDLLPMARLLNHNPNMPSTFFLRYFRDHEIIKIEVETTPHSLTHRLSGVYAKNIERYSELDPSVSIDCDRWAVTIVNSGKSFKYDPLSWGGHAVIIIEGRDKGAFFKHLAHLRKKKYAKLSLKKNISHVEYNQKMKTHSVSREAVLKMLESIEWEIKKQKEEDPQVFFDIQGNKSISVKPIFIKEYDSYDDLISQTLGIYKSIIIRDRDGREQTIVSDRLALTEGVPPTPSQQKFIQNKFNDKWTEIRIPDNCLTWAKRKLKDCKVHLNSSVFDAICATPRGTISTNVNAIDTFLGDTISGVLYPPHDVYGAREFESIKLDENSPRLLHAINEDDENKVRQLLKLLAEEKLNIQTGKEALSLACQKGNMEIIKLLLSKWVKIRELPLYFPTILLRIALCYKQEHLVEFLLGLGANVNFRNPPKGDSILHELAYRYPDCQFKILETLIKHGNVNARNLFAETPLFDAVRKKNKELALLYLKNKAIIDAENYKGLTPLWHACHRGDEEMVRFLIENGTNLIAAKNKGKFTNPFLLVRQKGFKQIEGLMNKALDEQKRNNQEINRPCLVS